MNPLCQPPVGPAFLAGSPVSLSSKHNARSKSISCAHRISESDRSDSAVVPSAPNRRRTHERTHLDRAGMQENDIRRLYIAVHHSHLVVQVAKRGELPAASQPRTERTVPVRVTVPIPGHAQSSRRAHAVERPSRRAPPDSRGSPGMRTAGCGSEDSKRNLRKVSSTCVWQNDCVFRRASETR